MQKVDISEQFCSRETRANCPAKIMDFPTFDTLPGGIEYFGNALAIEAEHGRAGINLQTNLTNDDPLATAMIVAAHLKGVEFDEPPPFKPFSTYYDFLIWIETLHSMAWQLYEDKCKSCHK
jgi:hypothetical protein